jgi:hypothetical protein
VALLVILAACSCNADLMLRWRAGVAVVAGDRPIIRADPPPIRRHWKMTITGDKLRYEEGLPDRAALALENSGCAG